MQLRGMKEISNYIKYSESTILLWIRTKTFPAKKVTGEWMSDTELIDEWRKKLINGNLKNAQN